MGTLEVQVTGRCGRLQAVSMNWVSFLGLACKYRAGLGWVYEVGLGVDIYMYIYIYMYIHICGCFNKLGVPQNVRQVWS